MSNLGFHSLFHRAASFRGIRTVRFFIEKDNQLFSPESLVPDKMGLFSTRPPQLKGFDLILFTVSFELDYINIIRMLTISSFPPLASERDESFPFVITGGVAPSANPLPVSVFSDLVFSGDMEGRIEEMLEILFVNNFHKSSTTLEQLSKVKGLYCVEWKIPEKNINDDITIPSHSVVLTPYTEFRDRFLIEVVRGCRQRCTFCMTRYVTRPVRFVREEHITSYIKKALPFTKKIGLIAPVLSDHPDLVKIVKEINRLGGLVSFSSLRADGFTSELAELLRENQQRTVTFAPETGSALLRRSIGKDLDDEELLRAVSIAAEHGVKKFRYYFMYGLPNETTGDILSITALVNRTMKLIGKKGCTLHLSINPFVPKKGTALQGEGVYPLDYYRRMHKLLERELSRVESLTVKFESIRLFYLHYQLSIGDRETGLFLYRCFLKGSMRPFREMEMR